MTSAAIELVRRAFDAFNDRDLEAVLEVMDPEVEFLPVTANITTGGMPYRGHDGMAQYLDDVARVWQELQVFPEEFREHGDTVVALGRIRARGGGMIAHRPTGWVWKIARGKIVYGRIYTDPAEALEAAGLSD